jgi:hypothetical protein
VLAAEVDVDDAADLLPTGSFGGRILEYLADEVQAVVVPGESGQRGRVCITLGQAAVTTAPRD